MDSRAFKTCPMCECVWTARELFLADPQVELLGYQPDFRELTSGLLLFNHACKSTLSIPVAEFRDLYNGPIFEQRVLGTDACPGHCLHSSLLLPCPAACECAYVREIIQMIRDWPKGPCGAAGVALPPKNSASA